MESRSDSKVDMNKRILKTIEESDFPDDIKSLLKALLAIELRNLGDSKPLYSEEYDRNIKKFSKNERECR